MFTNSKGCYNSTIGETLESLEGVAAKGKITRKVCIKGLSIYKISQRNNELPMSSSLFPAKQRCYNSTIGETLESLEGVAAKGKITRKVCIKGLSIYKISQRNNELPMSSSFVQVVQKNCDTKCHLILSKLATFLRPRKI